MRKRREASAADKRQQAYKNRAAMERVYESAVMNGMGIPSVVRTGVYWKPRDWRAT